MLETARLSGASAVERQSIHGDDRRSLKLQPPARASLELLVPERAFLDFGLVARPVGQRLDLRIESGGVLLHEERFTSVAGWSERRVDLGRLGGRKAEIHVEAKGALDFVALGEPRLLAPRPVADNVLVYVIDCLRADRVGAFGAQRGATPNLDALAARGAAFERAYSCAAWTKPSVGCLFTGLSPVRHGARTTESSLDPSAPTLAELLRRAGRATAAVVANPVLDGRSFGFARGFDHYLELARQWKGRSVNSTPADSAEVTQAALGWIERHRDQPFFLYLHPIDLHYPYLARPGFETLVRADAAELQRESDLYDSELAYTDRELGRLFEGLGRLGLAERTTVVVTADHGEEFGERGLTRHGRSLYDTLLHVPLVIGPAAGRGRPRRIATPVSHVDLLPTLADLGGAGVPPELDGLSLAPLLGGAAPPPPRALFAEQVSGNNALYAVREERFKLIQRLFPEPGVELYDVGADPGETRDLAEQNPAERARLLEKLRPVVIAGQAGLHLRLPDPRENATLALSLRSAARFEPLVRLVQRTGDTQSLSADGRELRLLFPHAGLDRHLLVRTQPADAAVELRFEPGAPVALRLGADGRSAAGPVFRLLPGEIDATREPPAGALDGAAWAFAIRTPANAAVSEELREQMRALGYLQ